MPPVAKIEFETADSRIELVGKGRVAVLKLCGFSFMRELDKEQGNLDAVEFSGRNG